MTTELALSVWIVSFVLLCVQATYGRQPRAGMALCYWLSLALCHLLTEILCLVHQNTSPYRQASVHGFPYTGYGMLGFAIGSLVFAGPAARWLQGRAEPPAPTRDLAREVRLSQAAIVVGLFLFLLVQLVKFPSLAAVTSRGHVLAAAGFAWWWWILFQSGRTHLAAGVLVLSLIVPALILLLHGFLSIGIAALLPLVTLAMVRIRLRTTLALAVPFFYLGLSLSVTYLIARAPVRQTLFAERTTSLERRLEVVELMFVNQWRWFDPTDDLQRLQLDSRLNQNYFLGLGVGRIDSQEMAFCDGETFAAGVLAPVPRVLWPDKPSFSGGTEQMSRFTGLTFVPGVSYGVGHMLETYANFGVPGLVVFFTILGLVVGVLDQWIGRALHEGRFQSFFLWFVPCQGFMNGSVDNVADITGTFLGGLFLVWLFLKVVGGRTTPAFAPISGAST